MINIFITFLNKYESTLSENDKRNIKLLNDLSSEIADLTINELANKLFISPSSLHRLIKKIGFKGYSEFKFKIAESLLDQQLKVVNTDEFLNTYINEIMYTHRINQEAIQKAAKIILAADTRFVFGSGWKQKQIADNFSADMIIYGENFVTIRTKDDLYSAVQHMTNKDVLIFTSLSGNIGNYQDSLKYCQLKEIPIISITKNDCNPLSQCSTVSLHYIDKMLDEPNAHWPAHTLTYIFNLLIQVILSQTAVK